MIKRVVIGLLCLSGTSLQAQVSKLVPPQGRGLLDSIEQHSPDARRTRQRYLDSLDAGRRRWNRAAVIEYQIESHLECLCLGSDSDSTNSFPLLTVRQGQIIGRSSGKGILYTAPWTVDSLFAFVERDLRDPGRIAQRLVLDSQWGFPRQYDADTPVIQDVWLRLRVDSFVVRRRQGSVTPP